MCDHADMHAESETHLSRSSFEFAIKARCQ